eukprot:TRINITY_DN4838_c0_g1_i4.p1 TRINITY_DN4838_c0_g1~~TRINITY_DN4838_c0_g1_i4.p1  ORF type:complete len:984 (-),score=222.34 TRINITY_DN4838_c0_g1_i4:460-3411(-)
MDLPTDVHAERPPKIEGMLKKRGAHTLTGWKERWFGVRGDRLCYFRVDPAASSDTDPVSYIPFSKINYIHHSSELPGVPEGVDPECGFLVDTDTRVLYLLAPTKELMWTWVDYLEYERRLHIKAADPAPTLSLPTTPAEPPLSARLPDPATPSGSMRIKDPPRKSSGFGLGSFRGRRGPSEIPAVSLSEYLHAGPLHKRGPSSMTGWKDRYFALTASQLFYFKDSQDAEPIGFIPLSAINFVGSSNDIPGLPKKSHGCGFCIDTDKRVFYMYADSRDQMLTWVDRITAAKKALPGSTPAPTSSSQTDKAAQTKYYERLKQFVMGTDTRIISALCSVSPNPDRDLESLLLVFGEAGQSVRLLKWALDSDICTTAHPSRLFTSPSSVCVRLLMCYFRRFFADLSQAFQQFVLEHKASISPTTAPVPLFQEFLDLCTSQSSKLVALAPALSLIREEVDEYYPEVTNLALSHVILFSFLLPFFTSFASAAESEVALAAKLFTSVLSDLQESLMELEEHAAPTVKAESSLLKVEPLVTAILSAPISEATRAVAAGYKPESAALESALQQLHADLSLHIEAVSSHILAVSTLTPIKPRSVRDTSSVEAEIEVVIDELPEEHLEELVTEHENVVLDKLTEESEEIRENLVASESQQQQEEEEEEIIISDVELTDEDDDVQVSQPQVTPAISFGRCTRAECHCVAFEKHAWLEGRCRGCLHLSIEHNSLETPPTSVPATPRRISRKQSLGFETPKSPSNEDRPVPAPAPAPEPIVKEEVSVFERVVVHQQPEKRTRTVLRQDTKKVVVSETDHVESLQPPPPIVDSARSPDTLDTTPSPLLRVFPHIDQLLIVLALCDASWLRERNHTQLLKILTGGDFAIVGALCQSVTDNKEKDNLARALVSVFEVSNQTIELLHWAITREVEQTFDENTLFRTDSIATKISNKFASIHGLSYMRHVLAPILRSIVADPNGVFFFVWFFVCSSSKWKKD